MNIQQATRLETAQSSSYVFMNMEVITDVVQERSTSLITILMFQTAPKR